MFQWGGCFSDVGASFLSGKCAPDGGISFDGGFLKKNVDGGGGCPSYTPTMGNQVVYEYLYMFMISNKRF